MIETCPEEDRGVTEVGTATRPSGEPSVAGSGMAGRIGKDVFFP